MFGAMDVDIHVGRFSEFEGLLHFEAMTGGHHETCEQEVDIGGTVGASELDRLFLGMVHVVGFLLGVGHGNHVFGTGPAERHAHEHRAVAVAPADGGGSLLVRNETEVGGGVGITKGGEGGGAGHIASDSILGDGIQFTLGHHLVFAVFDNTGMDVEATACLAARNLGSEGHIKTIMVGEVADNPFGENELVGSILHVGNQKFDFILFINLIIEGEVTHFGVAVLDQTAHLRDVEHALGAELLKLGEGG